MNTGESIDSSANTSPSWQICRRAAGRLASSFLLRRGNKLFEANSRNWNLPLSKTGKVLAGVFVILKDYSLGRFPPTFEDQARAYQAEINYIDSLPGVSPREMQEGQMRKPFWGSASLAKYSSNFVRLWRVLEELELKPKSRLLELGCGSGWMAEFLAIAGYSVVGTSIAPAEIALARKRVESLRAKALDSELIFRASPMEAVDKVVEGKFDAAFVFEALHHAFDWREALRASYRCLKTGGWLILANEPNVLHTFVAYRVARLSNTHEIGFRQRDLLRELRTCGFQKIRIRAPKFNNLVSPHWISARK